VPSLTNSPRNWVGVEESTRGVRAPLGDSLGALKKDGREPHTMDG